LHILLAMLAPLAAIAADTPAEVGRPTAEQRQARHAQWCGANPERCKEMQARIQQRMAECKADPEKCRAERQARFEQRFKQADKDGNGMISRAEAEQAMPRMLRHFDRIDADHDGQITREEIAAMRKARFEGRRQPERTGI